jgi:hypothetical protein
VWWLGSREYHEIEQISLEARHITREKIRAQLLESVERTRQAALADAKKAKGWEERERLRQAAEKAYAGSIIRVDELAASFAEIELAQYLGGFAFNLVLSRQFAEAQTRCEEAQSLVSEIGDGVQRSDRDDLIFIRGNLAHALLFQGHYDEALTIYRENWNKLLRGKTFGQITLEDFTAFNEAGLKHPDLSRMKQALGDLGSEAPSP